MGRITIKYIMINNTMAEIIVEYSHAMHTFSVFRCGKKVEQSESP